ncbi:MlaC/ttg2D family ABC transporter substrate-binding protein [Roseitranquillus sediminis]|uniref:MlaC/ttg2D family ABC transporter substrate-binding protein n=1 Tax=Roseitranquillus sediminis TaxID=2809051 RepID=UPI001D0C46EE|nr:ABC transporter substrate-binding protein [Roseitranquillus sediminis]MBM9593153.1 ABC transporter substrate-binding protein [Roseitranquillus sediminis]
MNEPTRRAVIAGALALAALPARALTTNEARALIERVTSEINAVINSGRSEAAMYRDFESIFARYADVPTIARSTLGPDARRASSAQLSAFADAFRGYIARKYGRRFRELIGGQVNVTGAGPVKSFYEVDAIADLRGQAPFEVTFLVSDRSGRDLFFDLLIEGISLLRTERTEVGAMLDRRGGNLDALIADLRQAG